MNAPPEGQDEHRVDSHLPGKDGSIWNGSPTGNRTSVRNKHDNDTKKRKDLRKRVSKACKTCARRKVKCDGNAPCMPCLLQGRRCQAKVDNKKNSNLIQGNAGTLWKSSLMKFDQEALFRSGDNPSSPPSAFSLEGPPGTSRHENGTDSDTDSPPHLEPPVVNQADWNSCFESFCRDIHPHYPFLHLPTLSARYAEISNLSPFSPTFNFQSEQHRAQICQIFICLAMGKFCETSYAKSSKGSYAGGWSLYSAAVHIQPDFLTSEQECSDPILVPQTIVLMVMYLCCVDATEQAKRLLSVAISQLHCIGCHRSSNMDTMPVFKDELLRRLWCCVYALERELGLQTEGPLLIQDSNVDFALPRNLGDFWLSSHREDSSNSCDLRQELEEEVAKTRLINVSFIKDKTWHARAVNRIWGALHHEFSTKSEISCILIESLEYSAKKAEQLSKMGTDSVDEKQKPCWDGDRALQKKHESLMLIKWYYLRLSISRTALRQPQDVQTPNPLDKEGTKFTCLYLIDKLLISLEELPNEYPKFTFPYLNFWITAVDLGLEMIAEDSLLRECYGTTILQGLISLREFCSRTWLSTRMTRRILSMSQLSRSMRSGKKHVGNSTARRLALQKSALQKIPQTTISPLGFVVAAERETQSPLDKESSSLDCGSTPGEASSAEMFESSINSTAHYNIDALDSPTFPSHILPTADPLDIDVSMTDCFLESNKQFMTDEGGLSNALSYGVSEIGLDGAVLYALSDAHISPFGASC